MTGSDQSNILASLVGRSLGYERVVTRIEDPSFEHVCIELGLKELIVPDSTIARNLVDICEGNSPLQLSAVVKNDARIFSFIARDRDAGRLSALKLPTESRVIFLYRNDQFMLADPGTSIQAGDEIVVAAHSKVLSSLEARWLPVSLSDRR
jgi:trk system potassium uptake protein TrkA